MAIAANIDVNLRMNTKNFDKGMSRTRTQLSGFEQIGSKLTGSFAAMHPALIGLAAATVAFSSAMRVARGEVAAIADQFAKLDVIAKASQRTGVAAESLIGFHLAAEEAGVGVQSLDMSLSRMQRRISEAATGMDSAVLAFDALGLSGAELSRLAPDEQFRQVAQSLSEIDNQTDRARIAMEIFGRSGAELLPLFAGGRAGLDQMQEAAERLGLTLSNEQLRAIEAANDRLTEMGKLWEGIHAQVAVRVAPAVAALAMTVLEMAGDVREGQEAFEQMGRAANAVGRAIAGATDLVQAYVKDIAFGNTSILGSAFAYTAQTTALGDADSALDKYNENVERLNKQLDEVQTGGAEAASVFEDWEDSLDKVADTADGVAETLGGLFEELKTQQIIDDLEEMTRIEREAADEAEAWAEWLQEQRIEGILKGLEQAGREAEEQLRKAELPSLPGAAERGTQEAFRAIMEARREDPALRLEQEQLRELQRLVNDSKRVWEALTNWEPVKEAIL